MCKLVTQIVPRCFSQFRIIDIQLLGNLGYFKFQHILSSLKRLRDSSKRWQYLCTSSATLRSKVFISKVFQSQLRLCYNRTVQWWEELNCDANNHVIFRWTNCKLGEVCELVGFWLTACEQFVLGSCTHHTEQTQKTVFLFISCSKCTFILIMLASLSLEHSRLYACVFPRALLCLSLC